MISDFGSSISDLYQELIKSSQYINQFNPVVQTFECEVFLNFDFLSINKKDRIF
jgi:hypothetical protein